MGDLRPGPAAELLDRHAAAVVLRRHAAAEAHRDAVAVAGDLLRVGPDLQRGADDDDRARDLRPLRHHDPELRRHRHREHREREVARGVGHLRVARVDEPLRVRERVALEHHVAVRVVGPGQLAAERRRAAGRDRGRARGERDAERLHLRLEGPVLAPRDAEPVLRDDPVVVRRGRREPGDRHAHRDRVRARAGRRRRGVGAEEARRAVLEEVRRLRVVRIDPPVQRRGRRRDARGGAGPDRPACSRRSPRPARAAPARRAINIVPLSSMVPPVESSEIPSSATDNTAQGGTLRRRR